jgi:hypothetical protein
MVQWDRRQRRSEHHLRHDAMSGLRLLCLLRNSMLQGRRDVRLQGVLRHRELHVTCAPAWRLILAADAHAL